VKGAHRKGDGEDADDAPTVAVFGSNEDALDALQSGEANVLGGTAWLWARPEFAGAVDVLFVDEAGQMALANVLAVCHATQSVVLLGDPQQLEQPQKGSHPIAVNASALQHVLGEHQTIPTDRGIFLPTTWRLAPSICSFTSELFYGRRLESKAGLEHQRLSGVGDFDGSGLWVVPVDHDGNRNSSIEEVEMVAQVVARLVATGARWFDEDGNDHEMTGNDILVVSPYNAQVSRLRSSRNATRRITPSTMTTAMRSIGSSLHVRRDWFTTDHRRHEISPDY
jgi:AAA domain